MVLTFQMVKFHYKAYHRVANDGVRLQNRSTEEAYYKGRRHQNDQDEGQEKSGKAI